MGRSAPDRRQKAGADRSHRCCACETEDQRNSDCLATRLVRLDLASSSNVGGGGEGPNYHGLRRYKRPPLTGITLHQVDGQRDTASTTGNLVMRYFINAHAVTGTTRSTVSGSSMSILTVMEGCRLRRDWHHLTRICASLLRLPCAPQCDVPRPPPPRCLGPDVGLTRRRQAFGLARFERAARPGGNLD